MSQPKVLTLIRRASLVGAAVGFAYLFMRFDLHSIGADRCSPLLAFAPGDRLIVDTRPAQLGPGEAILVQTARGALALTEIERVRADDGALWCISTRDGCPGFDSKNFGWVPRDSVFGRVILGWGG